MRLVKQTLQKLVREELSKVNERIEPQIKKIAQLTGTRPDAVEDFVSKHALNFTKLLKFLQKGKLKDRMDFMTAVSGKPGNPIQKKMIKMFTESVNEAVLYGRDGEFGKDEKTWLAANYVYDKSRKGAFFGELINYLNRQGFNLNKSSLYTITRKLYQTKDYTIVDNRDWKKSKIYHKSYAPKNESVSESNISKLKSGKIYKLNGIGYMYLGKNSAGSHVFRKGDKSWVLSDDKLKSVLNEASDEFVIYVEKDNGRKKLLHNNKSSRAAKMFITKNANKILNQSGIRAVGSMRKSDWERDEAQYAENIKKKGMRTVTKKQWGRTHNDYKGMIKGQPYMMWFDKKTQSTVYGPVQIKESVNEKIEDFETGDLVHIPSINKSAMVLTQYGRKVHVQFPDGKEKTFNSRDLEKIYNESVNEGRAFVAAAKKAKEEGKTEFEFNGKTYPVTIKEVLRKRNRKLR